MSFWLFLKNFAICRRLFFSSIVDRIIESCSIEKTRSWTNVVSRTRSFFELVLFNARFLPTSCRHRVKTGTIGRRIVFCAVLCLHIFVRSYEVVIAITLVASNAVWHIMTFSPSSSRLLFYTAHFDNTQMLLATTPRTFQIIKS